MPDEYYERYRHSSHDELYRQLFAGSPRQIAAVAHAWRIAQDSLESIAARLRADLDRLAPQWQSAGGREFQYRIDLVRAYAQKLGEEAAALRSGLMVMYAALRQAQLKAEPARAALPAAQGSGVLDSSFGHVMLAEEQAKAEQRMVTLVSSLAAEYGLADHGSWPVTMPAPPSDLPVTDSPGAGGALASVGAVDAPQGMSGPAGAGLAGAGHLGGVPSAVQVTAPPPPPATLGGALPGLSGAALGYRQTEQAHPVAATTTPGGAQAAAPMAGAGLAGRPAEGYAIADPRLARDGTDAPASGQTAWHDGDDLPPAVLGGS